MTFTSVLWIAIFGMFGVLSRYGAGLAVMALTKSTLPIATFIINALGSFLIGLMFAVQRDHRMIPQHIATAITVGFLGGFTTFSSFSLEALQLLRAGELTVGMVYLFGSPLVGVACALLGTLA